MHVIDAQALREFAAALLGAGGLQPDHAAEVAQVLVWADLRGVESHGVSRLPLYLRWLRTGEMNGAARPRVAFSLPALQVLDADAAPGAVSMKMAVAMATPMARDCGVGVVMVRGTTHTGALGAYTSALAGTGLVGIALAASGPNMFYHGAAAPGVSTAPLSIAVPRHGDGPIVFDMASGAIAFGRLQEARAQGHTLAAGSAADASGRPTTDAHDAVAPLPLGGPKGSGLALMIELVCSAMTGAQILAPALSSTDTPPRHRQNAMVLAFDLARTAPQSPDQAQAQVSALVDAIKSLPSSTGSPVLLPGERGGAESVRRAAHGIPLGARTAGMLADAAASLGIPVPWSPRPLHS
ncbi:Ldh family oxidoreductase [Caenimonas aquaedulcis]|uniref:Ldh family oxidoreductase n=1 Tax=Caenimonas aquaedulcis TaxID=2793270 RepID=A0A931H858_9BURK|nr:Ldh family oxidoreductase [Caenimonas aquaedulcis]MBG9390486.1 Ldh family oxidoreductase [Caenimonas aquaedulcis]